MQSRLHLGLRAVLFSLLVGLAGCGPSGGDDVTADPDADTDGDMISDGDEGAPGIDSDGDGTPDFQDDDSDGDGVPDYREAGDTDAATAPNDSDNDGTPDFRDTDSDDNGRRDGDDGVEDLDNDGRPNFADNDDDDDLMLDTVEMGDPDNPLDSDNDGAFDYQDEDSDDDSIGDYHEGRSDYDDDGTANYLDSDSDGDCLPDSVEGGGAATPRDIDDDNRFDFLDRDSDNDGIPDGTEDANCNGQVDGGESSSTDDDTDNDGVSDLIEVAAGTDPTNAADNPQANGDFVFIVPYEDPPSPSEDDLDFATDLVSVDVYVLLDRSGSMATEITAVRDNLEQAINNLQCPPLGTGTPGDCIPDLWAGAGTVGYAHASGESYTHQTSIDIQPNPSLSGLDISALTSTPNTHEATTWALSATITGAGSAGSSCVVSSLAARTNCNTNSPAHTAGYNAYGYPCFREGALPVVLLATDEAPLNSTNTYECPAWSTVRSRYATRGARIIGITGDNGDANVQSDLELMAEETGAIDATNGDAPLVFDGFGSGADEAIEDGVRTLARGLPLDLSAPITDDASDAVNAVTAFVDHLETLQSGTPQCANGLTDQDTNADGFDDAFVNVVAGTPVCWKVVPKVNTTVQPTTEPQLFRATVDVYGDGITVLDSRNVFFLVPPGSFDPPVN